MRRVLLVVMFAGAAVTCAGAAWIVLSLFRGPPTNSEVGGIIRSLWLCLQIGPAAVFVAAVLLQWTRPPGADEDWTKLASLGAGICFYTVGGRLLPPGLFDGLPGSVGVLLPLALCVVVAYLILWPVMNRKRIPPPPPPRPEPPRG